MFFTLSASAAETERRTLENAIAVVRDCNIMLKREKVKQTKGMIKDCLKFVNLRTIINLP